MSSPARVLHLAVGPIGTGPTTSARTLLTLCFADCNCDGDDVLAFFQRWDGGC